LFAALIKDQLAEYAYPAKLGGVDYEFQANSRGFELSISGFSSRQNILLNKIVNAVARAQFNEERFNNLKQELLRELRNREKNLAYQVMLQQVPVLQLDPHWSNQALVDALEPLQFSAFTRFGQHMLLDAKMDSGGSRPSGGSTISEACREGVPRSPQCAGGPVLELRRAVSGSRYRSRSVSRRRRLCSTRASNSTSFSVARSPNDSGRSRGVPCMRVLGQMPCRSGSPHGVRGAVHASRAGAAAEGGPPCAGSVTAAAAHALAAMAAPAASRTIGRRMVPARLSFGIIFP
jgi:hypothetical protein